jgi:hypothetical protein
MCLEFPFQIIIPAMLYIYVSQQLKHVMCFTWDITSYLAFQLTK